MFFRLGERAGDTTNPSAWRVDDVYLAHAALTDIEGNRFHYTERLNRAGPGIAGASFAQKRIWNGNWKSVWTGERQQIEAISDDFSFVLALNPVKPLVIHGVNGISQKAEGTGRASHYVSFTRLQAAGTLRAGRASYEVTGDAWMDHEWFTEQLDPAQRGWDWFSIQLNDGTDLMLFQLRRKDGTIDPFSAGTLIDRAGRARHLTSREFSLVPIDTWTSPKTGARYPTKWHVSTPALGLDITCAATMDSQELNTIIGRTSYWEGAVTYSGSHAGVGYLEMTGYVKPVNMQ
ncbi:MAG: hypothetical protein JWO80_5823 [Bryobacterales bacterium]|nr:hypothetical protein [Bryobacterales bacterium]